MRRSNQSRINPIGSDKNTRVKANDANQARNLTDVIPVETARTLDGLFRERARRSPEAVAYRDYDRSSGKWRDLTWKQMDERIAHWQSALTREKLLPGDRVAVMLRNCPEWVIFEQAALRLGLVVVPLYTADRPENAAYILRDAGVKVLLLEELAQWQAFHEVRGQIAASAARHYGSGKSWRKRRWPRACPA